MVKSRSWHALPLSQVYEELGSSSDGLSSALIAQKQAHFGPNLIVPKKDPWLKKLIQPFTSVFVLVLVIAVIISIISNEAFDALVIMVVISLNAIIFYFQQYSANRALEGLRSKEDNEVTVLRDKKTQTIIAKELVPGDVVYVYEGFKVPADARIIESSNLQVNESLLTGESLPVNKQAGVVAEQTKIYDQTNMVYKGAFVHSGSGQVVICETGPRTELGNITKLAGESYFGKTPIEKKIDGVTKSLVLAVSLIGIAVFGLALIRGIEAAEALRFSISLVVSIVPEGLPVTLTIVLLFSAQRMAKHGALVKKLSAIETMGAVTLIATDKTGTLTKNDLQVAETYDASDNLEHTIRGSITVHKGVVLDALDKILQKRFSMNKNSDQIMTFPFDQTLKVSGSLFKQGGKLVLYLKGAPEGTLLHSKNPQTTLVAEQKLEQFTKKGYRTIAFAHLVLKNSVDKITREHVKAAIFDGFVALSDPIRPDVRAAVSEAKAAGIKIVMLTGDHINTAAEISRQAGIITNTSQVGSADLLKREPSSSRIRQIVQEIGAFGRVLPEQKFNFVKALQNKEVTAMTGDGVNDIPALVEADAGLAMGSGTDAAKDAADIVLLDDKFSTIIKAVRLGRSVIANIQKMLFYLISSSIGEAGTMLGALIFGLPLPVTAIQILWINIVTDGFTVLPLGLSKPEPHQMKEKPRDQGASLIPRYLVSRFLISGGVMAISSLLIFNHLLPKGYEYAQTATFIALVVAQWANVLNANNDKASWVKNLYKPNWLVWAGIGMSLLIQGLVFFGPLREAFGIVSLTPTDICLAIMLPIITVLVAADLHKLFTKFFITPSSD